MTGEAREQLAPARARSRAYTYEPPNQWHPGLVREHIEDEAGDYALCGVSVFEFIELDEDDPPMTFDCRSCVRTYEEGTHA